MKTLTVDHRTVYRYAAPVALGPHRMLIRPRDSHDMRLLDTRLIIAPAPVRLTWVHDVFSNSVAVAEFDRRTDTLSIESRIVLRRYPAAAAPDLALFPLARSAESYPFRYGDDDLPDLVHLIRRHYPDPNDDVRRWAAGFLLNAAETPTKHLLLAMTQGIKTGFDYRPREREGTQPPAETLALRSGTCRDYALLMMEALRALGLATRFVTGYLYDPAVDSGEDAMTGGGATHAWVSVYLPGAGWTEFDPTNGCESGANLIRVAATRDPSQAIPISGTWSGADGDFEGLTVEVNVSAG
jgi:transglutaminase-like putative cysteine protease